MVDFTVTDFLAILQRVAGKVHRSLGCSGFGLWNDV